ncbi:phytoene/squalene synthase family protein [Crocinitomicaceae bacterium]|jgi:15-cis-phytoene synthase|nr:phytoene/squalene synthase family protein [Crocinitomicaceae bacterium]
MKSIFDTLSHDISEMTTKRYSTSFSLGISFLSKDLHNAIYGIYGFVRFADEIVDSFHGFDKDKLLTDFKKQTFEAIGEKISLNPILNSFQWAVNEYKIPIELIDTFLKSMEMDLDQIDFDQKEYEKYILGSAEVVGLMCLKVFVRGDDKEYLRLKPSAMKLGSAFQKINFLRDLSADYKDLDRTYFPGVDMKAFNQTVKKQIEADIELDFKAGYEGIKQLPKNSRFGVYMAYKYYYKLFQKIKSTQPHRILKERVRIRNTKKYRLFLTSIVRHNLNIL